MNFKKSLFLWAVALLITASGAFAQVKKKPVASPKSKPVASPNSKPVPAAAQLRPELLPSDPNVIVGKLPNGLTYYIKKNTAPQKRAELLLVTKAGSVLETDAQQGVAHFIAHMAIHGTRDFPKDELINYLRSTRAGFRADSNISSSYDETVYRLSVFTDTARMLENGFKLLANWATNMNFDPTEINNEREIILNELKPENRSIKDRLQQQTLSALLNNSRYALRQPLGKEDIIKTVTPATLKGFYKDWYRPDMQAIVAVGDFDPKSVEQLIKSNFSSLTNPAGEKPRVQYSVAAAPGTVVKVATDNELPYTIAEIIVKHPQAVVKSQADLLQEIRVNLFNQMMSARIDEIARQNDPPFAFSQVGYGGFLGRQNAFTSLVVANGKGFEVGFKAFYAEIERARKFGFTATELERAKQNTLQQIVNEYKQKQYLPSESFEGDYVRNFLTGNAFAGLDYEYNYYVNNIGKISTDEMLALAKSYMTDQNRTILLEGPTTDKASIPNEPTLLQWMAEAGKGVTAYVDYSTVPLMTQPPTAGKVVSTKVDTTIDVTTLMLSNGVKVILKPTILQKDQIFISGYSFGGTSLASDADFTSANLSSIVIGASGVAGFGPIELGKMIKDKNLSISPYIGDITQGISGYSSISGFEPAMQLMYLYFMQPRKDPDVWKSNILQAKTAVITRATEAITIYQDTVAAVLSNYNPRGMTTTLNYLNTASLDKAYDFYKARFADASNFTFTFTGAFTVDAITPYIETYLGSLPSTNSKETYKNLSIHPPAGQITKTVYKGDGNKSAVQLVFSGAYEYNEANNIQMDALEWVLSNRLRKLDEKETGVILPEVKINYVKIPEGRYKIAIYFDSEPATVDRTVAFVMSEINKLKLNGPDQKEIEGFITLEANTTQMKFKQNAYWAGALPAAEQNQEDPDRIINHIQMLGNVTPASGKIIATKYLDNNNLIKLILLPQKK